MIVCDTSTLSLFFRRPLSQRSDVASEVEMLIRSKRVVLLGIVRQELLTGIKSTEQFDKIESVTRALPTFYADDNDHILAAQFYNVCRTKGVQGSAIDFLICSMSVRRKYEIFSTDPDFSLYEPIIPIQLYHPKPI